ncbi:testis-expressed protein 2-like isoform X2 [Varroa destructor]|uniref:SMP-LTD domain-containing protein n=1 Tax=Varroa destructor TaxID=109461 RepID=A0A7M7KQ22_VARDE|nr:testis-expressed protein 2-like isoform X2 [Varroa destructor]
MFKGRSSSGGGASGESSGSKSLLLETSFRFHPGQDDIKNIVRGLKSSPVSSSMTLQSSFSPFSGVNSSVGPATPLQRKFNATFAATDNQSDDEDGSKNEFREDALLASSSLLQSPTTEGIVFSEVGASGKTTVESTDSQDKDSSPPPPSTPQHNAVKDLLVNRFRKGSKDQKSKESPSIEKDKRESPFIQSMEACKDNHGKAKEIKDREVLALKESGKDGGQERDSRSPSPGDEARLDTAKGSNKEKEGYQESKDASWFGGIKGKIVKRFEEKRTRSQSVPIVAKAIYSQGDAATGAEVDSVTLGHQGEVLELGEVERAEEADPERMALEQGLIDCEEGLDVLQEANEDDSWEKVKFPLEENDTSRQRAFYRDFAAVKARWIALDSAYIAARFPDVIEELRNVSMRTVGVIIPLTLAIIVLPLPAFGKGFLAASLAWLAVWRLSALLCPPASTRKVNFPPLKEDAPMPPPLLMPRIHEMMNASREGWLNALPAGESYNVRTHIGAHSHSVHVRLEGTMLRIRALKEKLPRHAMWNERRKDTSSVVWLGKQWFIELEGATVRLQPEGLSASKLWDKKYPIVISTPARQGNDAKEVVLFARTCRDKEYWFRLLKRSAEQSSANTTVTQTSGPDKDKPVTSDDEGNEKSSEERSTFSKRPLMDFLVYMDNLGFSHSSGVASGGTPNVAQPIPGTIEDRKHQLSGQSCCPPLSLAFRDADTQWLNVVAGRLLFDFFTQPRFAEAVRAKFQEKLSKIRMPLFLEELTITDVSLGARTPLIRRTSAAVHCPDTGVWLDLEVAYNGCFQVTVHTKLNLMRLKRQDPLMTPDNREQEMHGFPTGEARPTYDDIPSEDDDDDISEGLNQPGNTELEEPQGATSKRIVRMVDRIWQWPVFQQATDYAFIRRMMEDLSNTDLKLTIQLSSLAGRLAINIPPPPTDRLWYGFRSVPRLELKAIPQMGERQVLLGIKLAAFIERVLFQRVLVMPNMDDLQIDIMEAQPL